MVSWVYHWEMWWDSLYRYAGVPTCEASQGTRVAVVLLLHLRWN